MIVYMLLYIYNVLWNNDADVSYQESIDLLGVEVRTNIPSTVDNMILY